MLQLLLTTPALDRNGQSRNLSVSVRLTAITTRLLRSTIRHCTTVSAKSSGSSPMPEPLHAQFKHTIIDLNHFFQCRSAENPHRATLAWPPSSTPACVCSNRIPLLHSAHCSGSNLTVCSWPTRRARAGLPARATNWSTRRLAIPNKSRVRGRTSGGSRNHARLGQKPKSSSSADSKWTTAAFVFSEGNTEADGLDFKLASSQCRDLKPQDFATSAPP